MTEEPGSVEGLQWMETRLGVSKKLAHVHFSKRRSSSLGKREDYVEHAHWIKIQVPAYFEELKRTDELRGYCQRYFLKLIFMQNQKKYANALHNEQKNV